MRSTFKRAGLVLRALGWRGLLRRFRYVVMLRSGLLGHRLKVQEGFDKYEEANWNFRFDLDVIRDGYDRLPERERLREEVVNHAARVLVGEIQLYGWTWKSGAWPPLWHDHPFTGRRYPLIHWIGLCDDDPQLGDIKDVWELSRLPFTFLFARAYVLTDGEGYVEAWWEGVEDWASHNPPNLGVNWRCGQETSLRAIALCFGLSVFGEHPASTPERVALVERVLSASVERVRPTISYALSQRNNHAISELVFMVSVLGPERGLCRLLLEVLDDQFYPDGSYSQQSFTYQRLAVETLQWLLVCREDLPPGLRARVGAVLARSRDFLERCSDPVSGWLPNYGPNDGTRLFQLSRADYRDFRPLLTTLGSEVEGEGAHETAVWVPCDEVASRSGTGVDEPTTYATMRGPNSLLLTRLGAGRHRPGHADQQSMDLWIDGRNVVIDPGTYRYTAPPPWRNALAGLDVHSTSCIPGESVASIGRFLLQPMPPAELVHHSEAGEQATLVSRRAVDGGFLWRAIVRQGHAFAIFDFADGVPMDVRWNLGDLTGISVHLAPADGLRRLRPLPEDPVSGWASDYYAELHPIDARVVSVAPGGVSLAVVLRHGDAPLALPDVLRSVRQHLPTGAIDALPRLLDVISAQSATVPVHDRGLSGEHR